MIRAILLALAALLPLHTAWAQPAQPLTVHGLEAFIADLEQQALAAPDSVQRLAYLDSALVWYDQAVPRLRAAGLDDAAIDPWQWTLNHGRFLQKHEATFGTPKMREAYARYRQAYELDPERLGAYYYQLILYDAALDTDCVGLIEIMDRAKEVHPVDPELGGYIEDLGWLSSCWPFDWEDHYDQLMEEHPRDIAALTQVFEHAWYVLSYDKAQTLGALLLAQNPIPAVISIVGQMALEDGDPEAAMPLLQRALNLSSSEEEARDIYFGLGVAQQELGRLSHARDHYRRALEADPDFGRALLAIGDLYVTTVSQCGSLEPEDKAVYWLAADYYERAKARDSAGDSLVDNAANARLSNIRSYFPIEEEKHAAGWPEGAAYRVDAGCYRWISEATRVR